jgi:hypothetical protein
MEVKVKPPKKKTKEAKEETKETKEIKPTETKPAEAKEIKPTTKETKPTTKPTTKTKPKIKTTTWEKFEKFEPKTKTTKKSWIKEAIKRAQNEPIEIRGLSRGQLTALITQVNRHNQQHGVKLDIKYDFKRGIAIIAPIKRELYT